MPRFGPLLLGALVVAAFAVGYEVRGDLGFELSTESIRAYVRGLGVKAPILFLALVVFRNFLLIPSMLLLTVGGLVFGAKLGTVYGGLGIVLSAGMKFSLARGLGREWLRPRIGGRFAEFEARIAAAGPIVIGLATAHPMGPMSPFHWAAGFSRIPWLPFMAAVALAGPIRAGAYSLFGASLTRLGSTQFFLATGMLVVVSLLPLLHPAVRGRIFNRRRLEPGDGL